MMQNIVEQSIPEGLFVILTGERYYYTVKVDSLGNYKIENVAKGNYQLFISAGMGGMILIDDIKISGEKKHNFTIKDDQKQQIEDMIAQGLGGTGEGEVSIEDT